MINTQEVFYDGQILSFSIPIQLQSRLLIQRIKENGKKRLPTKDEVTAILRARSDVPDTLKQFIIALFERHVVESFSLGVGIGGPCKAQIKLATEDARGKLLMMDGRLQHFIHHFSKITGQPLNVKWKSSLTVDQRGGTASARALDVVGGILDLIGQPASTIDVIIWG